MFLKEYNLILLFLFISSGLVTILAVISGSSLSYDAWFLPVIVAQIWVLSNNLRDKDY
jgi:hypothetical protein